MTVASSIENGQKGNEIMDLSGEEGAAGKKSECLEILESGRRCRMAPLAGESYCVNHSNSDEAEQIRRRCIVNSITSRRVSVLETRGELSNTAGLRRTAARLIRGLADGSFDTERARVIAMLMRTLLWTFKVDDEEWEDIDQNRGASEHGVRISWREFSHFRDRAVWEVRADLERGRSLRPKRRLT